jgi:hypothetical protein
MFCPSSNRRFVPTSDVGMKEVPAFIINRGQIR